MEVTVDTIRELVLIMKEAGLTKLKYAELELELPQDKPRLEPAEKQEEAARGVADITDYGVVDALTQAWNGKVFK